MTKTKAVNYRIPRDISDQIDVAAENNGVTKTAVVIDALEQYFYRTARYLPHPSDADPVPVLQAHEVKKG